MIVAADDSYTDEEVAAVERSACPTCGSCSGMFTANSMNCLTEALGLSLPGNGSHAGDACRPRDGCSARPATCDRRPGQAVVRTGRRDRVAARPSPASPRSRTAMCLDISMGGSTNTVLHLLAAGARGRASISRWRISTDSVQTGAVPLQGRACASADVHMEDVHRAGGDDGDPWRTRPRWAGGSTTSLPTVHAAGRWPTRWRAGTSCSSEQRGCPATFYRAAPDGVPTQVAFSQSERWDELDDRPRQAASSARRITPILARRRPRRPVRQPRARGMHRQDCRRR